MYINNVLLFWKMQDEHFTPNNNDKVEVFFFQMKIYKCENERETV